jgi:hypothetical protein
MPMYNEMLDAAIDRGMGASCRMPREALSTVIRCRQNLHAAASEVPPGERAVAALADQLAYDLSLIEFSRALGIECEVENFAQPLRERARLERALRAIGFDLQAS